MATIASFVRDDLRLAVRTLRRSPGFTITAVLSLALGIGAACAAFGVLDAVRFRALPFPGAERLVTISEVRADLGLDACRGGCDPSYETYANVLRVATPRSLGALAAYTSGLKALGTGGEPIPVFGGIASHDLFALLGARPVRGRAFLPDDDRVGAAPVVVLSHELWTTQFGADPAILGRVVKLSDTQYTVIGVMGPGFDHESRSRFWLAAAPTLDPSTRPSIRNLTVIGRLAPGRTIEQLRAELATLVPAVPEAGPGTPPPTLRLEALPLRARYAASTQSHDLAFAVVVGCVLLIAAANIASLVLVRALHQQREFAIRSALGGGARALLRTLLAQHVVIVAAASALGLLLAWRAMGLLATLDVLQSLRPTGMEYRLDARVAAFAVLLAAGFVALLSLVPARLIRRTSVQQVLRESSAGSTGGRWGSRAQQGFVVAQLAAAVVLLTGAGLLTRTVLRLGAADLGFAHASVMQGTPSFPHPWRVPETYLPKTERIVAELRALPAAADVAVRATVPLGGRGRPPVLTTDRGAEPLPAALVPRGALSVGPEYFRTLGIPLRGGRTFTDRDVATAPPVAIVNEWAARRWWPGEDAVGRTVRVDTAAGRGVTLTIVGVVRDNRAAAPGLLLAEDGPELYRPWLQAPSAFPTFLVRARGAPASLLRPVREVLVREVPDRPVFGALVSETVGQQLSGVRTSALQVLAFAMVGLLLALTGIHGVLAYSVGRRTRELGIRRAVGASRATLLALVLRDAVVLVAAGLAIGLPLALAATRLIEGMLHGTARADPAVYAIVGVTVAVVAMLASWWPARRAARVDPMVALRGV